ncbi:restriction endonuclease [Halonatronum saccharophilum]|uniref:restriction endonuclease n=1 Tax=Halonatronum saccharophilum TaxID=150060 RepID=UPI0004B6F536|nr:restriction endonuclease [Halonatronum saccharophilum]
MIDYFSNFSFDLSPVRKYLLLTLASILAITIGFSLVLYPYHTLLVTGIGAIFVARKQKAKEEERHIDLARPHIKKFIDYFFNSSPENLDEIEGISKNLSSLQKNLKEEDITLRKNVLVNLILEELILSFIRGRLSTSFRIPLKEEDDYEKDLKALIYILDKMNIKISRDKALSSIMSILKIEKQKDFYDYFFEKNLHLKNGGSTSDLATAYVNTFEDDLSYISYLKELAKNLDISLDEEELEIKIEEEIEYISLTREAQSIYRAMAEGRTKKVTPITLSTIDQLSGEEFELFLKLLFTKLGYKTTLIGCRGDQGADLIIEKENDKIVIQAKRYKGNVGNKAVQEVLSARAYYECNGAMIVTNSHFSPAAIELARSKGNKVTLWNRENLSKELSKVSIFLEEIIDPI